jgi:hypothetical protein
MPEEIGYEELQAMGQGEPPIGFAEKTEGAGTRKMPAEADEGKSE